MNDYLWDKTGEPDEDVKELEELLGSLAYRPRPLELPEPLPRHARMSHSSAWTRIAAIAAALFLMLLAGASLMLIRQRTVTPTQHAVTPQPSPLQMETQQHTAAAPKANENDAIRTPNNLLEIKRPRNGSRSTARQVALSRSRRQPSKRRLNEKPAPSNQETAQNVTPLRGRELTDEERQAKDQLMLALRFASANLRYVQEQVREVGIQEKPR